MNAADLAKNEKLVNFLLAEALELIAKTNGRTFEEAQAAFLMKVPNVYNEAANLVAVGLVEIEKAINPKVKIH